MNIPRLSWLASVLFTLILETQTLSAASDSPWSVIVANDTCPDVTWGFTFEQTGQAFADLTRAHLDEMKRTDLSAPENRDHYNMTATIEALSFVARYPERKGELIARIREGRVYVSPFLCNSLWGFQSVEGAIRTFYPARRLEREWRIPIDIAEHIELPSLPWGMASILAGSGIRWISVPFYDYDSTFKGLKNPPLFRLEGPDGSEVRVVMDAWASLKASYAQGANLLQNPRRIGGEWVPHYAQLGAVYPLKTIFASGTHSDINPNSGKQARGFADSIAKYNAGATNPVTLRNGTLAQFCREVDAIEAKSPFLPKLRGCFGHSWELWPVSLARTVAELRAHEREYLAAESLVAIASRRQPALGKNTRVDREQAEWYWAMLADHAWNGTDPGNKRHNAELRQNWADGLDRIGQHLARQAWQELGLVANDRTVTVFNPLSFANDVLVRCSAPEDTDIVTDKGKDVSYQDTRGDHARVLVFVATKIPPFGFREYRLVKRAKIRDDSPFRATGIELEGPFYRLKVDLNSGGLSSIVHQASGQELVGGSSGRSVGQTVFFSVREQTISHVESRIVAEGPVLARMRVTGNFGALRVTNDITLYAQLDRVDFDIQIEKPATTNEQRLLHFFPVGDATRDLRLETTASVLRPSLSPEGDLLPGADTRRFAIQGFVDYSPTNRVGVTVAPLDAFMLRLDQEAMAFEALGNDQNWKEVSRDQNGATHFRFRYSLRAHLPGYDNAAAFAWSRSVMAPTVTAAGRLPKRWVNRPHLEIDPTRALATCLKPADDATANQVVARIWETGGTSGPLSLTVPGYRKARKTDLLERDRGELIMSKGKVSIQARGHGFVALRLEP